MTHVPSPGERQLPDDAAERSDHEVIGLLFGEKAAAELERMAGVEADAVMPPA